MRRKLHCYWLRSHSGVHHHCCWHQLQNEWSHCWEIPTRWLPTSHSSPPSVQWAGLCMNIVSIHNQTKHFTFGFQQQCIETMCSSGDGSLFYTSTCISSYHSFSQYSSDSEWGNRAMITSRAISMDVHSFTVHLFSVKHLNVWTAMSLKHFGTRTNTFPQEETTHILVHTYTHTRMHVRMHTHTHTQASVVHLHDAKKFSLSSKICVTPCTSW